MPGVGEKTVGLGKFVFEVPVDSLTRYCLHSGQRWLMVWLEPGKDAAVTGGGATAFSWSVEGDVSGQHEFNQFQELKKPYIHKIDSIFDALKQLRQQEVANSDMADPMRLQTRNLEAEEDVVEREMVGARLDLIRRIPVNEEVMEELAWFSRLIRYTKPHWVDYKEEVAEIYAGLSDEYKNSDNGTAINGNLYGAVTAKRVC